MADPKYANLPGIAYDQPDVYETSDLPEVDQASFDIGDESESVESFNINGKDAYNKFTGKKLESLHTDFSDRISHDRRTGYVAYSEYEMAEDDSKNETVLQKYQRLQHETRCLMEEVAKIQKTVKSEKKENESPAMTVKQVEQLEKQLLEVRLEEMLASDVIESLSDPNASLQKNLLSQVEKLKTVGSNSSGDGKTKSKAAEDQLMYELHYKPELSKFIQSAKVAEFEQRIQNLEDTIGHEPDKLNMLAIDTNHKNLLGAITILNSKLNLLDTEQLDQTEVRLHVVGQKLSQLGEKGAHDASDKENKINEAYGLLKKIDSLKTTLPDVVDRMIALKQLHEQALQFSKALTQLDVAQQHVVTSLEENRQLAKEVQANFAKNMETVNKNIANLDSRLAALKKK